MIDRFQTEVLRLLAVMDSRLEHHEYLAGDYSIADIACWPWVRQADWNSTEMVGMPHLKRWFDQLAARPGVQRGIAVSMVLPQPASER